MLRSSLLGVDVPMSGKIPLDGKKAQNADRVSYFIANECERETDYLRWQKQRYRASEYEEANTWRSSIPIDALENSRNSAKDMKPELMEYKSIDELVKHVECLLNVKGCER